MHVFAIQSKWAWKRWKQSLDRNDTSAILISTAKWPHTHTHTHTTHTHTQTHTECARARVCVCVCVWERERERERERKRERERAHIFFQSLATCACTFSGVGWGCRKSFLFVCAPRETGSPQMKPAPCEEVGHCSLFPPSFLYFYSGPMLI